MSGQAAITDVGLWDALPLPALLLDADGRALRINPAAEGFLNLSARSAEGAEVWSLLRVADPPKAALARVRANGAPLFVEDLDIGAGPHAVPCSLSVAPLGDDRDQLLLVVAPHERSGQMRRDGAVRSAARSAIGMADMLAHEIKNPLAGIIGAAQLLSMRLEPDARELTDLIVGESRRIAQLLEQVETFGNRAPPDLRAINIHDVLARARRSAQLGFAARMSIIEDYDPSLPEARGDAGMLLQVLQNLMKNAAEAAGPAGGTIRLRSFFEHGAQLRGAGGTGAPLPLQIEVVDDGPGVPPALMEGLFEPFVSGRDNGTGLGLALAARIMADHGGLIRATSAPGRTVFRLSLPLAAPGGRRAG